MTTESLDVSFGLTQESSQRFRDLEGHFAHLDESMRGLLETSVDRLAVELESHLRAEFQSGTDSQGQSHDKTGATLATFETHTEGLNAVISMGGGAPFVEYGRGEVTPQSAHVLHWIDPYTGEDVFSMYSSPVAPDDFVGRAIDDVDLHGELSKLALGFQSEITRTGDYGTSISEVG